MSIMKNFLSITVILLATLSCSAPTSGTIASDNGVSTPPPGPTDVVTSSEANGLSPAEIQFPVWWVQSGYNKGGSPLVVVFSADGKVHMRQYKNEILRSVGTWTSSANKISVRVTNTNLSIGSNADGSWNNSVNLNNTKLIKGSSDFTQTKIVKEYIGTGSMIDGANKDIEALYIAKIKAGGKMNFAGSMDTGMSTHDILQLARKYENDYKWSISPLGDYVTVTCPPQTSTTLKFNFTPTGTIGIDVTSKLNMPVLGMSSQILSNAGGSAHLR